jgi:hypothetical protein
MKTHPFEPHAVLPAEAIAALARGRKIEAIRIVRKTHGVDLKTAKERVEAHALDHSGAAGDLSPGEVPAGRGFGWALALAAAASLALWWWSA